MENSSGEVELQGYFDEKSVATWRVINFTDQ